MKSLFSLFILGSVFFCNLQIYGQSLDTFLVRSVNFHIIDNGAYTNNKLVLSQETFTRDKKLIRKVIYDTVVKNIKYISNFFYKDTLLVLEERITPDNLLISFIEYKYDKNRIQSITTFDATENNKIISTEKHSFKDDREIIKKYRGKKKLENKTVLFFSNTKKIRETKEFKGDKEFSKIISEYEYNSVDLLSKKKETINNADGSEVQYIYTYDYPKNETKPKFIYKYNSNNDLLEKTLLLYYPNGLMRSETKLTNKDKYIYHLSFSLTVKPLKQKELVPRSRKL